MLSASQNARLTQTAAGTPMGEMLRRYWHPIAPSGELNEANPTKEVRLLGEDLVLYRSASGQVGLIEPSCPHRKANLSYGVPEPEGIRCCYHGWLFNEKGECLEQPSEPFDSRFKEKVRIKAYPVQERGGLIFAYLGPEPAPVLPHWDLLSWKGVKRHMFYTMLPCNWIQCMENSLDPVHFEWLHRYWGSWVKGRRNPEEGEAFRQRTFARGRHHLKLGFDRFEYGIIKRRLLEGESLEDPWWRIGHPILFPNVLRVGQDRWHSFQFRIPVDDTHTLHLVYRVNIPEPGETFEEQEEVPWEEIPLYDENGRIRNDYVVAQDQTAWVIQGAIMDRPTEKLGVTDVGLIMYRKLLEEQVSVVEDGGDPINVHREDKGLIVLPQEHSYYPGYDEPGGPFKDTPLTECEMETDLSPTAGSARI